MNHQGSAEHAFAAAILRNVAERKKFIAARPGQPLPGAGEFGVDEFVPRRSAPPQVQNLELAVSYRDWGVASGLRGRGLVADDQLGNLGFKAEIARTLLDFDVAGDLPASWVIIPGARWFANAASPDPNSGLPGGLTVSEWGGAVETGVVVKLGGPGPGVQVRLSAGPGWRFRRMELAGGVYEDQGPAACGTFGLAWTGRERLHLAGRRRRRSFLQGRAGRSRGRSRGAVPRVGHRLDSSGWESIFKCRTRLCASSAGRRDAAVLTTPKPPDLFPVWGWVKTWICTLYLLSLTGCGPESPDSYTLHGVHIKKDEYLWLEKKDDYRVQTYSREQNYKSRSYLSGLLERKWLARQIHQFRSGTDQVIMEGVPEKVSRGERIFYWKHRGRDRYEAYCSKARPSAAEETVLDLNAWPKGPDQPMEYFIPSPSGNYAVFGKSQGGAGSSSSPARWG